jgi:hypothetical protein
MYLIGARLKGPTELRDLAAQLQGLQTLVYQDVAAGREGSAAEDA